MSVAGDPEIGLGSDCTVKKFVIRGIGFDYRSLSGSSDPLEIGKNLTVDEKLEIYLRM